jgi:hypothetical protein
MGFTTQTVTSRPHDNSGKFTMLSGAANEWYSASVNEAVYINKTGGNAYISAGAAVNELHVTNMGQTNYIRVQLYDERPNQPARWVFYYMNKNNPNTCRFTRYNGVWWVNNNREQQRYVLTEAHTDENSVNWYNLNESYGLIDNINYASINDKTNWGKLRNNAESYGLARAYINSIHAQKLGCPGAVKIWWSNTGAANTNYTNLYQDDLVLFQWRPSDGYIRIYNRLIAKDGTYRAIRLHVAGIGDNSTTINALISASATSYYNAGSNNGTNQWFHKKIVVRPDRFLKSTYNNDRSTYYPCGVYQLFIYSYTDTNGHKSQRAFAFRTGNAAAPYRGVYALGNNDYRDLG